MRSVFVSALVVGSLATATNAQNIDPAIRKAKEARDAARHAGDEQAWGRYTSDDFLVTQANGTVNTKAQRMAQIKGNKATTSAPKVSEEKARTYGNVVILAWREDEANGATRFTEVWVREGMDWKVVAVHLTPVAKP
jgi:hypothetical protein